MPQVAFALRARICLEQRLARELAQNPDALRNAMTDIEARLAKVFPNAKIVLVQDLYQGFRVRPEEYVLLVEIVASDREDGPTVVKLGPPERLGAELLAWESCRPQMPRHDLVLMGVQPCYDDGRLIALRYDDAAQLIGVDQTLPLESALLEAVRHGAPTPQSVADVLFQLYERLGLLLYRHAEDEDPAAKGYTFDPARLDGNLLKNLGCWDDSATQAFLTRSGITTAVEDLGCRELFRDPARMIRWIIERPQPAPHLPRLLRGRSHGDLHGRNVLVGRVGDRVLWPAVYDYGTMGRDNLIGWDFVKMECEFKMRAYPGLFSAQSFVSHVLRFETELFQKTELCRQTGGWPASPEEPNEKERLGWLILSLRRLAEKHLSHRNRSQLWLHEYYFLLALYGLNAGRFDNLTPIQQKAAYLSAGAAAQRFADTFR